MFNQINSQAVPAAISSIKDLIVALDCNATSRMLAGPFAVVGLWSRSIGREQLQQKTDTLFVVRSR